METGSVRELSDFYQESMIIRAKKLVGCWYLQSLVSTIILMYQSVFLAYQI